MATQYKDDTFGETLPFSKAFKVFMEAVESDTAKAFHVGTPQEIEKVKENMDFQDRLDVLSEKVADLQTTNSKYIIPPTFEDIKKYEK